MHLKLIACNVICRELSYLLCKNKNHIDVTYMQQGLHNTPDLLRESLQKEIDLIDSDSDIHSSNIESSGKFDAILLGYGLCSNGICGISSKKYSIIIPRAHDCTTLFLGSKEKYDEYFHSHNGIYWYTSGWIEKTPMPSLENLELLKEKYTELYGEENAEYLVEMNYGWKDRYGTCAYVQWPDIALKEHKEYSQKSSREFNWVFDCIDGDSKLLDDFLSGNWDNERFLIVPPGASAKPSYDSGIISTDSK